MRMKFVDSICAFILLIISFSSAAQNLESTADESCPYLYELVEGYAADNFEYPETVDDILSYWQVYKCSPRKLEILTERTVNMLDSLTFDRLEKEKEYINIQRSKNKYTIRFKQTKLFVLPVTDFCHPLRGYALMDRTNMRTFFRVSMQNTDSGRCSIATEEMQYLFNKGLYTMVASKSPLFRERRNRNRPFNAVAMIYENGHLTSKCCSKKFNPNIVPLYDDVLEYVANFAEEYKLSRILFYYMYD